MSDREPDELGERVLVLAPTARDAAASRTVLAAAGMACHPCSTAADVCREVERGAGAVVITAEAVLGDADGCLAAWLKAQPPWSDLPVVVLTPPGPDTPRLLRALEGVGPMTLMKRPVQVPSLVSTIRTALRDRRRQYAVRDLLAERERAEAALREADHKKDDFIALLAHELRNPLAPVRNGLEVIRMSDDREVRARSREIMDRQLGHMVRLIDDLLDVSRIGRNKMELRRARVPLAAVVESAVEAARPQIDAAGHRLEVSLPPEPVVLDADLTRLAQVFSNLLTNSAKYTEPGGRIWLTAEARARSVTVTVRDTGIGIPAAAQPTIFDMFSQVDRSIERNTGGLGIGLALVKGLVEMHGGTVTVESAGEDRGTTFRVRLPVVDDRPDPAPADAGGHGPRGVAGRRVLVVDDNRDGAASMATMLRLLGNEVRTAHDGVEAVEAAEAFRPEVILMDVGMPRLNGYEATRQIRERPWGRGVTVVALTGWGQENDRAHSKEAGCDAHLVKPVTLADLEALLGELRGERA